MVDSEFHSNPPFSIWPVDNFFSVDKPGKSGLRRDKTRGMRFFLKKALGKSEKHLYYPAHTAPSSARSLVAQR
ncbi:hypothetical protein EYD00_04380 [Agrobacterium sp. 33MFTa1.1]|nr:hypothetical protein EYD00_04380 [Agrobacterium sp. 33MFTa1.1]